MAEENDETKSPSYSDWGFGRKKERNTFNSKLGTPGSSLEQVWLEERERAAKEQENPSSSSDPESEEW